jgi:hypothetical protein
MIYVFLLLSELLHFSSLDLIDFKSGDPWPHVDDDGYYQSFQENGRWVNWWAKNKPSVLAIGAR